MTELNCAAPGCRRERALGWHLACPTCWHRLPEELRQAVWYEYKRLPRSAAHLAAIRECEEWWKANPEPKQQKLFGDHG